MYVYIYFYLASDQHNNNAFIPICFPFKEKYYVRNILPSSPCFLARREMSEALPIVLERQLAN